MKLHLVSFKTCPYVQRSVITLKHKGQPFDITYIDLADPPQWFQEKSPLGKVPIVEVTEDDGTTTVLFESAVINEFVNEITPGDLLPKDPVRKARARAWIEFASECNTAYYLAAIAKDDATYAEHRDDLLDKLAKVEAELAGEFFDGDFGLVDTAFAPLLQRLVQFEEIAPGMTLDGLPKIQAWRDRLLALEAVQDSIVPEWPELNLHYLERNGSYVAGLVAA